MSYENLPIRPEKVYATWALFLYVGSEFQLLRLHHEAVVSEDGDPLQQLLWAGTYLAAGLMMLSRPTQMVEVLMRQKLLVLILCLAFLSALWSVAPELTLRRAVALTGTTLTGIYIATRFSLPEVFSLLGWALGIAVVLSYVMILALPEYGIHDEIHKGVWRGIFFHKNRMGAFMLVAMIVFSVIALQNPRRAAISLTMLLLSVVLWLAAKSATALTVGLLVAAVVPLVYGAVRFRASLFAPVMWVAVSGSFAASVVFFTHFESAVEVLGRDATLTGRTELWQAALVVGSPNLWLGAGYGAFWADSNPDVALIWQAAGWMPIHAHNGFLEVFLDLGGTGLILLVLLLLQVCRRAFVLLRHDRSIGAAGLILILITILAINVPERSFVQHNDFFWLLVVIAAVVARPSRLLQVRLSTRYRSLLSAAGRHEGDRQPYVNLTT